MAEVERARGSGREASSAKSLQSQRKLIPVQVDTVKAACCRRTLEPGSWVDSYWAVDWPAKGFWFNPLKSTPAAPRFSLFPFFKIFIFYFTSFLSPILIILANGVTDHIISTQKTIKQNLVWDICLHVSSIVFRYFTAFVNLDLW